MPNLVIPRVSAFGTGGSGWRCGHIRQAAGYQRKCKVLFVPNLVNLDVPLSALVATVGVLAILDRQLDTNENAIYIAPRSSLSSAVCAQRLIVRDG